MKLKILLAGAAATLIVGCTASVNKASVQATATAPVSMQVEAVRIPYDASKPMYVVTVEPLQVGTDGSVGGPPPSTGQSGGYYGWGPSAGSVRTEVVLHPMLMQRPCRE